MADKIGIAASFIKDALLLIAPDPTAQRVVWALWRAAPDYHEKFRVMTNCVHDGVHYGNWPWNIGPRNL